MSNVGNPETIARILRYHRERSVPKSEYREVVEDIAKDLSQALYSDDQFFDRTLFLSSCGVE
jgi:hypothetical protein